jgi:hypothetical protein
MLAHSKAQRDGVSPGAETGILLGSAITARCKLDESLLKSASLLPYV